MSEGRLRPSLSWLYECGGEKRKKNPK